MVIFGSAAAAALVRLRCPKCGELQARARLPEAATYECRKCGATFTQAEGKAEDDDAS